MADKSPVVAPGLFVERQEVSEADLRAAGVRLDDFPGSTAADFRRYPVLSEGGWFMVIKHQRTLRSVSREPWRLLGPVPLASDGLSLD
ncbi:MAG: hypothetical protein M3Y41_11985 [Pseudomonadota bacterium]|nr:hypothetical protein [Pseudomonadota bacterium]